MKTDNLTAEQIAIVNHNHGPALVFAVAGAGKTTAMVHRIERLVREGIYPAKNILAASFGRETVQDIKRRLKPWPHCKEVNVTTLHGVGKRIIKRAVDKGYRLADNDPSGDMANLPTVITRRALRQMRQEDPLRNVTLEQSDEEDFCNYVSSCKAKLHYADLERASLPAAALHVARQAIAPQQEETKWYLELYKHYERVRFEMNVVTFDDMLVLGWELLLTHDDLLADARANYACVMIDEFQDLNLVQSELLHLITGPTHNLMAIGDDDQTIYEWRGARVEFILEFGARYDATKYLIRDNFRSHASHIALANAVIHHNTQREPKRLSLTKGFDGATHVHLVPDADSQARTIVHELKALLEAGKSLSDSAILVRTYGQTPKLEAAFESAGIPYRLVGGVPFYKRTEVAALLGYLRLAQLEVYISGGGKLNVAHSTIFNSSFSLASNNPSRYISKEIANKLREAVLLRNAPLSKALVMHAGEAKSSLAGRMTNFAGLLEWLGTQLESPVEALLERLVSNLNYKDYLLKSSAFDEVGEGRARAVDAFIKFAKDFSSVAELLNMIDGFSNRSTLIEDKDTPAVSIMTIHRAKGKEWQTVFIPDLNDNTYPFNGDKCTSLEEERRLLYVALTRPKETLHLLNVIDPLCAISRFLVEADFTRTLSAVDAVRDALRTHPQNWTTPIAHGIAKGTGTLHLEQYFAQWWTLKLPKAQVQAVAHGVQRLFRSARKKQLMSSLGLQQSAETVWETLIPPGNDGIDYPDLEALVPEPTVATATQTQKSNTVNHGSTTTVGAWVRHAKFGVGVIASVSGTGQTLELMIDFSSVGQKSLLHQFAQLEAIA